MIILEGPDNSGKTTLLNQLSDKYSLQTLKKSVGSDRSLQIDPDAYLDRVFKYDIFTEPWLLDRFFLISGSIYGPILSTNHRLSAPNQIMEDPYWLSRRWEQFNARQNSIFTIWCIPPLDIVISRETSDEHMDPLLRAMQQKIYWSYHAWGHHAQAVMPTRNFVFNSTRHNMEDDPFYNWFETALRVHAIGAGGTHD